MVGVHAHQLCVRALKGCQLPPEVLGHATRRVRVDDQDPHCTPPAVISSANRETCKTSLPRQNADTLSSISLAGTRSLITSTHVSGSISRSPDNAPTNTTLRGRVLPSSWAMPRPGTAN